MAILLLILCVSIIISILLGNSVAASLGGISIFLFLVASQLGLVSIGLLNVVPNRILGNIIDNKMLLAIPYFILMGKILEKTNLAQELLEGVGDLLGKIRGGLGISIILVGSILAASTSIVAATVVSMTSFSLPVLLKNGYSRKYSVGVIIASGTLGQILPPSIVLIVLADQFNISVGDIFKSAITPSLILISLYIIYTILLGIINPSKLGTQNHNQVIRKTKDIIKSILPPFILIICVLGSIFNGIATPTESGVIGCIGAIIIAKYKGSFNVVKILQSGSETVKTVASIIYLLIGSTIFALVFRAFGGAELIEKFFLNMSGGETGFILFIILIVFLLGFVIDFFEICFIIIPLILPTALQFGIDIIWLSIIFSLVIQTSFLTPPFGFSLFFFKAAANNTVSSNEINKAVIPFIALQMIVVLIIYFFPSLV